MSDDIIPDDERMKTLTLVAYILYLFSLFIGVTAIIGIIINYVKKEDVVATWLESHFRWQIRTFWFGLLWAVVGFLFMLVLMAMFGHPLLFVAGVAISIASYFWFAYRILRGLLNLSNSKSMPI